MFVDEGQIWDEWWQQNRNRLCFTIPEIPEQNVSIVTEGFLYFWSHFEIFCVINF